MLKKTLILGMILTSLLIAATYSASAADETKTIDDAEDDVLKYDMATDSESIVKNKPNVDITKIKYEKSD